MSWIRFVDDRPTYSRRLPPPRSYDAWTAREGRGVVDAIASHRRFSLFGRTRAAKRDLWSALREHAEQSPVADRIAAAVDAYLPTLSEIATVPVDLPRIVVSLRRVVVIPRIVCNATVLDYINTAVDHVDLRSMEGSDAIREYFSMELLSAIDEAVFSRATTSGRAIATPGNWAIVDADRQFSWWVPLSSDVGHDWRGHYVLYEAPPGKLPRSARRELGAQLSKMNERLPTITRHQRNEIVTQARARMRTLTAKALERIA